MVVRGIDSSLHMDYTTVGQTTHLAVRVEQMAKPGSALVTAETLQLAEGHIQVKPLGPVAVKGVGVWSGLQGRSGSEKAAGRGMVLLARRVLCSPHAVG